MQKIEIFNSKMFILPSNLAIVYQPGAAALLAPPSQPLQLRHCYWALWFHVTRLQTDVKYFTFGLPFII